MTLQTIVTRCIAVTVLTASLLLAVSALPAMAQEKENAELKRNLCGGANLSLSAGGNEKDGYNRSCTNPNDGTGDPTDNVEGTIQSIVNLISVIIGIVAVIMIIIGGLRYVTSGGDSGKVSNAKNTIIYAIVGLIVVALAQVIVKFVISETKPT